MKKIIITFVLMCFIMINTITISAQDKYNGQCGDNVFWEYSDRILRIYGSGDMTSAPWLQYKACQNKISKIIIEEGVTSICDKAFFSPKTSLQNDYVSEGVILPKSLKSIGEMAFAYIYGIKEITIPSNVVELGEGVFSHCSYLQTINISAESQLKVINKYVFSCCYRLQNIVLPETIENIDEGAFVSCRSLKEINLPSKLSSLGEEAFYECDSLESIKIPSNIDTIQGYTFAKCYSLKEIELSENIKTIGDCAFSFCDDLQEIKLLYKLEEIGKNAFVYCVSLKTVELPEAVMSVGENAFEGCSGLTDIKLNSNLKKISKKMFYDCSGLKEIHIPNTVTEIEENAFEGCVSLKELVIPESITYIAPCHQDCSSLKKIHNKSNVTYSLSASKLVMDWYSGKKKVKKVKPGEMVTSKGKRFKIIYSDKLLKKYKIKTNTKLPTSYIYGKEPKLPKNVKSDAANMLFKGWRYEVKAKKYETGATRTWYNARVTQFSKGLKGDIMVYPMIDKVTVKKNSSKKVVLDIETQLKAYLMADSIDLAYVSVDPSPRFLILNLCYADNKKMKNVKYHELLRHDSKVATVTLKNLKKGKTYYIKYRSLPSNYYGVPSETCWGETIKLKVK